MSYEIKDIRKEYDRLDRITGTDTRGLRIVVSRRFKRKLGMCRFEVKKKLRRAIYIPTEIVISERVLDSEDSVFYDTIRHEYAHAVVTLRDGCNHGHDEAWKRACKEVGCRPKSTASSNSQLAADAKYIVRCQKCGGESRYYRKGRVVDSLLKGTNTYRCRCGGVLELQELKEIRGVQDTEEKS